MKKLLMLGLLAAPLAAFADGLSYNYLEGGYSKATQRDGDENDRDADGYYGKASGKIAEQVYLYGDYRHYSTDKVAGSYAETDQANIGIGVRFPVAERLDLTVGGGASFAQISPKGPSSSLFSDEDDTGYFVEGGARALLTPALEVNGGMRYTKVFDESETTGLVGAVFNFTPSFGVSGGYEFGDSTNAYLVGARLNF